MGGVVGTMIGVLAMAVSILAVAAFDLFLGACLDEFGGIQIAAVSFVLFAVLGWLSTAVFLWRWFEP